ncbi:Ig-like domain-containing protein [Marinoscillum furvescens]|uniref:Ig-like domain-containing protein n=1 Tax=Marinoscillum furvescens DSM 4134 TaxID=1122208 RepID=A0A3D9KY21_MARFU|nr:Ig-like domain-containing protein [Marinoscillum furvescens]RED94132.1 Ig-like domain-containing protein [Marinoscillum furvescens DSM 4134]
MKNLLVAFSILIILDLLTSQCANPLTPTGGPKDTIPPTLISSTPEDQSLLFDKTEIVLSFDERVTAEKLKSNLVITPIYESKFKTLVKKNIVTIQFEEDFEDSTTYTLNFFDGITDITEKNAAENLIIAFSTGNYIDSLSIIGAVKDLFSNKPMEKMIVGLYRITDSLDFKKDKPTYFTSTDEYGAFKLQNIKANNYRLLAFKDENRNLLFDAATEAYGFKADTLKLVESITDSLFIPSLQIDASSLEFISARPTGRYYEVKYTKQVVSFDYSNSDSLYLPAKIVGENKTLRFYNNDNVSDSTQTIVSVRDSLANSRSDTLYVMFKESSRKPEEYSLSLLPKNGQGLFPPYRFHINFSKPSTLIDSFFVRIPIDTLIELSPQPKDFTWNSNNTQFSFQLELDKKQLIDTITNYRSTLQLDSVNLDSLHLLIDQNLQRYNPEQFKMVIVDSAFISVEHDTSTSLSNSYKFGQTENYGLVRVQINTDHTSYRVQLMSREEVAAEMSNCSDCTFTNVKPGDYWVRVLIDSNQDGKWTIGNLIQNKEPEPVYYFPEETTLRANWEVELSYTL